MHDAISPIDGRYRHSVKSVSKYFSHNNLLLTKVVVECKYLLFICDTLSVDVPEDDYSRINSVILADALSDKAIAEIQTLEGTYHHDIKAIIEFVRSRVHSQKVKNLVHFGLTSEDVVSVANNYAFQGSLKELIGDLDCLLNDLNEMGSRIENSTMLARTHGQYAVPTTFHHQMSMHLGRINKLSLDISCDFTPYHCKFGGAIGTLAAHRHIVPDISDWRSTINRFISDEYDMKTSVWVTQTDYYHSICRDLQKLIMLAIALQDFCTDMWLYANNGIITMTSHGTGSSTMSQKSNPVDFENGMANCGLFISAASHFVANMGKSMLQRDLSSSSLLRNLGTILSHLAIAISSTHKGINRVAFEYDKANSELLDNYQVLAEYVQLFYKYHTDCDNIEDVVKATFEKYNNSVGMSGHEYVEAVLEIENTLGDPLSGVLVQKLINISTRDYI